MPTYAVKFEFIECTAYAIAISTCNNVVRLGTIAFFPVHFHLWLFFLLLIEKFPNPSWCSDSMPGETSAEQLFQNRSHHIRSIQMTFWNARSCDLLAWIVSWSASAVRLRSRAFQLCHCASSWSLAWSLCTFSGWIDAVIQSESLISVTTKSWRALDLVDCKCAPRQCMLLMVQRKSVLNQYKQWKASMLFFFGLNVDSPERVLSLLH